MITRTRERKQNSKTINRSVINHKKSEAQTDKGKTQNTNQRRVKEAFSVCFEETRVLNHVCHLRYRLLCRSDCNLIRDNLFHPTFGLNCLEHENDLKNAGLSFFLGGGGGDHGQGFRLISLLREGIAQLRLSLIFSLL